MHPVAAHGRQIRRQIHRQLHVPVRRFRPRQLRDIADEFGQVEQLGVEDVPLEQGSHSLDDPARSLIVGPNVRQDRADFFEVRRLTLHEEFRSLGITQNRAERLIDLVRKRRSQLSHHRDAANMRDLVLQSQRLQLCLPPFRDVSADAVHSRGRAGNGVFHATRRGDPGRAAIGQSQAVL